MMSKKKKGKNAKQSSEKGQKKIQEVHDAIRRGSLHEIKRLIKKVPVGAVNAVQQTPLHTACIEGETAIIELLMKKKADVNAVDRDNWTPLHCACHSGHLKIVEILITNSADVNVETVSGSVALDYFVRISEQDAHSALFERLFRTMIRKGANVNKPNKKGDTPLQMAASRGKEKSVALLLLCQANPNAINCNGETALHLAVRGGFINCVNKLLGASADWGIVGKSGNCLHVATTLNNSAMLTVFKEKLGEETFAQGLNQPKEKVEIPTFSICTETRKAMDEPETLPQLIANPDLLSLDLDAKSFTHVPDVIGSWNQHSTPLDNFTPFLSPRSPGTISPARSPRGYVIPSFGRTSASPQRSSDFHDMPQSKSSQILSKPKRETMPRYNSSVPSLDLKVPSIPKQIGAYAIGECVGSGAFGSVFSGLDQTTGAIVALKRISLCDISESGLEIVMAELALLKRLEYKHITQYLGFIRDEGHINIILEFIEGGSLANIVRKHGGMGEALCAKYISQTILGLQYLHTKGIIHRDIKCANILVTKSGIIKLADFGISSTIEGGVEKKGNDAQNEAAGSPYWMAPEIIKLSGASTASDIWSLGCTVIELLTGKPPYSDLVPVSALFSMVKDPHPPFPENLSEELEDFLCQCFRTMEERPTADSLLSHPWIAPHVDEDEQ